MHLAKYAWTVLAILILSGCNRNQSSGYTLVERGGQPGILLKDDSTILIRAEGRENPLLLVGVVDNTLQVLQLEEEGATPFSVSFTNHAPSSITIERPTPDGTLMIMDKDADGIPDFLIRHDLNNDITEASTLKSIEWEPKTIE